MIVVSESMSILVTVWYRPLKFVTHLQYVNTSFCENVTLIHCSVHVAYSLKSVIVL